MSLVRHVAGPALFALALSQQGLAADNRVKSVDVRRVQGGYELSIHTEHPPTFQSYVGRSPAMLLVDLVDTTAEPQRIASPGAPIEEIGLEPKNGRAGELSRLWVKLSRDTDYDVIATGSSVTLSVFDGAREPRPAHEVEAGEIAAVSSGTKRLRLAARLGEGRPKVRSDASPRLAQEDPLDEEDEGVDGIEDIEDIEDIEGIQEGSAGMSTGGFVSSSELAMTFIGFKNQRDASEIYARLNGQAQFEVKRAGENLMVLEIAKARIPLMNNKNHLDTTFFESPVKMITPTEVDDREPSIRVIIEMREDVPYQTSTRGNDVVITFKKGG